MWDKSLKHLLLWYLNPLSAKFILWIESEWFARRKKAAPPGLISGSPSIFLLFESLHSMVCFYNSSILPRFMKLVLFSGRWMWLWRGADWVSCLGGWMAAAARCFLAHCFEMTLPVSLSTSAGRARIFIFFLSLSFSLLAFRWAFLSEPFLFLSLSRLSEQGAPTSPLPWSCWSGGWERGMREGGRVHRSSARLVEFCRLPRWASR